MRKIFNYIKSLIYAALDIDGVVYNNINRRR